MSAPACGIYRAYTRSSTDADRQGRTSHCLIFVTKDFKGVEIMREVMAGVSYRHGDGVAAFTYERRPRGESQPELPDMNTTDKSDEALITVCDAKTRTVTHTYETHHI